MYILSSVTIKVIEATESLTKMTKMTKTIQNKTIFGGSWMVKSDCYKWQCPINSRHWRTSHHRDCHRQAKTCQGIPGFHHNCKCRKVVQRRQQCRRKRQEEEYKEKTKKKKRKKKKKRRKRKSRNDSSEKSKTESVTRVSRPKRPSQEPHRTKVSHRWTQHRMQGNQEEETESQSPLGSREEDQGTRRKTESQQQRVSQPWKLSIYLFI